MNEEQVGRWWRRKKKEVNKVVVDTWKCEFECLEDGLHPAPLSKLVAMERVKLCSSTSSKCFWMRYCRFTLAVSLVLLHVIFYLLCSPLSYHSSLPSPTPPPACLSLSCSLRIRVVGNLLLKPSPLFLSLPSLNSSFALVTGCC